MAVHGCGRRCRVDLGDRGHQRPPPDWELWLTARLDAAPDALAKAVWPVMQLGNAVAPFVAGAFVVRMSGDRMAAATTAASGVAAWYGAKLVKRVIRRGRQRAFVPATHVREGDGAGLGYVSGHSAVSAALAVSLAGVLPGGQRWIPAVGAAVTGLGRVVYGMHLPAGLVGGWSFGALLGLLGATAEPVRQPA